ncbi:MAG: CopD family protein [Dehalococcoidia bacterium]
MSSAAIRWLPRGSVVLLVFLWLTGAQARPADAHANLFQSDPPAQSSVSRAPEQVQLVFTEPVEPRFIEVSVLDRDRNRVDGGDAQVAPGTDNTVVATLGDVPPGVYTISWQVVSSVDGHTTRGLIPFNVGDPGAVPDPLSAEAIGTATSEAASVQRGPAGVIGRWMMLLSMLALGGLTVAVPLLVGPVGAQLKAMANGNSEAAVAKDLPARMTGALVARVVQCCWIALGLFAAGSLLVLVVDAAAATGTSLIDAIGQPVIDLLGTRRGVLWLIRSGLAVGYAALLLLFFNRRDRQMKPSLWFVPAVLVAGMLLMTSLGSHSAALTSRSTLATAIDWIHLCATSLWIGGLIFLAVAFFPSLRPLAGPARTRLLAFLVPRFSTIALASVGVIIVTGSYQTWRLLGGWSAFRELDWGRALLLKLALVVLLLALGAVNLLLIRPRMAGYAQRMDRATRERAASLRFTFRRVVIAEAVLGAVILLVVGVLTGVSPSETAVAGPEGPFRPFVLDATSGEGYTGRLVLSPGRIGNNRFDLSVQRPNGAPVPPETSAVLRITTLDQETGTAEAPMEALGGGRFTTTGAYLSTVGLWEIAAVVRQPGADDITLTFALSLTESTGRPQVEENRPAAPLARGRELYEQNCIQCHGAGGRGDGPLAAGLRPPPLDLTVHVPLHSDQELENWIANGVPRTAMPAFGSQFSPEEIQAVINYIRELARLRGTDR